MPPPPCDLTIRPATVSDLPRVVALFAAADGNERDQGKADQQPLDPSYASALLAMARYTYNRLYVADVAGHVAGVFQLTILQHVAHRGGRIAQVETVFVDPSERGAGVGEAMMRWAIEEARRGGCFRIQLTSYKERARAHGFYERLGFVATHEGMKLPLR